MSYGIIDPNLVWKLIAFAIVAGVGVGLLIAWVL